MLKINTADTAAKTVYSPKFVELLAMADTAAKTVYSPKRGDETVEGHAAGCRAANATSGGWWGPFLP